PPRNALNNRSRSLRDADIGSRTTSAVVPRWALITLALYVVAPDCCAYVIRKLLLRGEGCATGDDPPAILVGMDMPDVVANVEDDLRVDLLHKGSPLSQVPAIRSTPGLLRSPLWSRATQSPPKYARRTTLQKI